MSVQDLAKASGTSASTVSRFARRLNFGGYNELKLQLSADLTEADSDSVLYEGIQRDESLYAIKAKLLTTQSICFGRRPIRFGRRVLRKSSRAFKSASRSSCLGSGYPTSCSRISRRGGLVWAMRLWSVTTPNKFCC